MTEKEMVPDQSGTDKDKEGGTVSYETNSSPTLVTEDMAAAAGFNVKSPILNAVIQNLTQLSPEETEGENSQEKRCFVCNAQMSSECEKISHILGKRHKSRMWSLRIIQNLNQVYKIKTLVDPAKGEYVCPLCKVTANSPIQLVSHMRSKRHTKANSETGIILSANPVNDLSGSTLTYFCQYCEIELNSHKKMLQHKASIMHLIRVERTRRVRSAMRSCY